MKRFFILAISCSMLQGCVVAKVASTTASVGSTAISTTTKTAGAAVDVATPDRDD